MDPEPSPKPQTATDVEYVGILPALLHVDFMAFISTSLGSSLFPARTHPTLNLKPRRRALRPHEVTITFLPSCSNTESWSNGKVNQ